MDTTHREYVLEVFSDQNFVRDIIKGKYLSTTHVHSAVDSHRGAAAWNQCIGLIRIFATGVLHTIFFHRYFPSIRPSLYTPTSASPYSSSRSQESLPVPLPAILEPPEISAAIESNTANLVSQLSSSSSSSGNSSRGEIVVQLFDRKRRKTGITGGWLGRLGGGHQTEEEICWEEWVIQVVVARPRSEAGKHYGSTLVSYIDTSL